MCAALLSTTLLAGFGFQADFARTLQEKLAKYYQRHVPVKIHLTFNQPRYAPGDTVFYSAVYGYRPPALQLDYPKPDLRFFVEAVGERTARGQHFGFDVVHSGGASFFVGPTALLLYKEYGLEGGILFPVYQQTNGAPAERFRIGVNVTYFFWRK